MPCIVNHASIDANAHSPLRLGRWPETCIVHLDAAEGPAFSVHLASKCRQPPCIRILAYFSCPALFVVRAAKRSGLNGFLRNNTSTMFILVPISSSSPKIAVADNNQASRGLWRAQMARIQLISDRSLIRMHSLHLRSNSAPCITHPDAGHRPALSLHLASKCRPESCIVI